jgi:hypothetical protein
MVSLCMGSWDLPIRSPNMIAPSRGIVTKNWLGTPVLIGASVTIPRLPLLRGSSDVVRARITKASIARQNIASVVAVVERVILAVPINGTWVELDRAKPKGPKNSPGPVNLHRHYNRACVYRSRVGCPFGPAKTLISTSPILIAHAFHTESGTVHCRNVGPQPPWGRRGRGEIGAAVTWAFRAAPIL